jgi:hypothetical protein
MGKNSGLADGKWPPDSGFPTTANFVLRQGFEEGPAVNGIFRKSAAVRHNDIKCGATWMPDPPKNSPASARPMPTDWVMCDEGRNGSAGFQFRFKKGSVSPANPTSFLLEIERVGWVSSSQVAVFEDANEGVEGSITAGLCLTRLMSMPPRTAILPIRMDRSLVRVVHRFLE